MSDLNRLAVKVQNLSKIYRLGSIGSRTLGEDINRLWNRLKGKPNLDTSIIQENDRSTITDGNYVWALKDVNIEIQRGEILGIIGSNGAGKSTLLKILSRITGPSEGSVKVFGRMASLLEVGTGFHPELTGRENIFLNGAILGMSKKEIETKIHDIIEFSGCSRYIDTPVKRYSSGMTVRLGFAVAAFLDPDILVVDEVLAVGDAEFQKKAIGKIKSVSREHDRTVIFVSHNMDTVRSLCSRAILMKRGKIVKSGLPDDIIQEYLIDNATKGLFEYEKKFSLGDDKVKLSKASISSSNDESIFYVNSDVIIQLEIEILDEKVSPRCVINLLSANDILITSSICNIEISSTGKYSCSLTIPSDFLNNSIYQIDISAFTFSSPAVKHFEVQNLFTFEVIESNESFARQFFKDKWSGALRYNYKWQVSRI